MRNISYLAPFLAVYFCLAPSAQAGSPGIDVFPPSVIQGEPLMISVNGVKDASFVRKITLDTDSLSLFSYKNKPTALAGIDLRKKTGRYEIKVELQNGQIIKKIITVGERKKIEEVFGIPQKLGGNTPASQNFMVSTLSSENKDLADLRTGKKVFWKDKFTYPLAKTVITDNYGYLRKTGTYSIAHKGVDFKAEEGTPVKAINRGVVRAARVYRNYGKTVVVDHGLGLMSFYMHLSKIKVNEGELVLPGQSVGLSGQTGYAERPHLHLSVRIGGVSIDPIKFLGLFN